MLPHILTSDGRSFINSVLSEFSACTLKMLNNQFHLDFDDSRFWLSLYIDEIPIYSIHDYTVVYLDADKAPDNAGMLDMTMVTCDPRQWRSIRKPVIAVSKGNDRKIQQILDIERLYLSKMCGDDQMVIEQTTHDAPVPVSRQPTPVVQQNVRVKRAPTMSEAIISGQAKAATPPPVVQRQQPAELVVIPDDPKPVVIPSASATVTVTARPHAPAGAAPKQTSSHKAKKHQPDPNTADIRSFYKPKPK